MFIYDALKCYFGLTSQPTDTIGPESVGSPVLVCNVCLCEHGKGLPYECSASSQQENTINIGKKSIRK